MAARLKMDQMVEWIKNLLESERKVVVFAAHQDILYEIRERVGVESVLIDGSVTGRDRQAAVDQFQQDRGIRMAACNVVAGGTGITLTASSSVVFAELDWRPGIHVQAEDRCHRIGTTEPVFAYYLVAKGTIEERLCSVLQQKQSVLSAVLDGGRMVDDLSVFDLLIGKGIRKFV
jgi:SNF2 family DNA or RNA helicase